MKAGVQALIEGSWIQADLYGEHGEQNMRINTRFTVAVHIMALLELNKGKPATSEMMAMSVGTHPVVIRQIMSSLKKANLIETKSGLPGGWLKKPQEQITLFEIYQAVKKKTDAALFDCHQNPSPFCPIGRNIKGALEMPLFDAQAALEGSLGGYTLKDVTEHIIEKESSRA